MSPEPDITRPLDAEHRHGTDVQMVCNQCGTSWSFAVDGPTQCAECFDHLGELIDPAHPDVHARSRLLTACRA